MPRSRPEILSFRVARSEKLMVSMAAEDARVSVSELLWTLVIPSLRYQLAKGSAKAMRGTLATTPVLPPEAPHSHEVEAR